MFGGIARRYDLLNHLLSANLDRRWRRAAAARLGGTRLDRVLDLCGGTGDLALEVARQHRPGSVICCDFSHPMLVRARAKFAGRTEGGSCLTLEADALRLPFEGGRFDADHRSLRGPKPGRRMCRRVRGDAPGIATGRATGRARVQPADRQPCSQGRLPLLPATDLLPRIGDRISRGRGAYGYLARTIGDFPDAAALAGRIARRGSRACDLDRA